MKNIFSTVKNNKLDISISILWYAFSFCFCISLSQFFDWIIGISLLVCLIAFGLITQKRGNRKEYLILIFYFADIPIAIPIVNKIMNYLKLVNLEIANIWIRIAEISLFVLIIYLLYELNAMFIIAITNLLKNRIRAKFCFLLVIGFATLLFFILPSYVFLTNVNDFCFSYFRLLYSNLLPFLIFLFANITILGLVNKKIYIWGDSVLLSLYVLSYIQYLLLNKYIGKIDGSKFDWKSHFAFSIIDLFIWISVIIYFLFISIKKEEIFRKLGCFIIIFLCIIQFSGIIAVIFTAHQDAYKEYQFYYSGEKQYKLAQNRNVIIFVIDAVDNYYIKNILEEQPEIFDDFNDFTLYTNTCSLYSLTNESMAQMFTGADFDHNIEYSKFYDRLRENDFGIYFFNYAENMGATKLNIYIDNYCTVSSEEADSVKRCDYNSIRKNSIMLVWYEILPDLLKGIVHSENIDFTTQLRFRYYEEYPIYYDNEDFYNHMSLELDNSYENYFIMQHIYGAHMPVPNDDYNAATIRCLKIVSEYIEQMKMLGVYDNATIIITSDHGAHNTSPMTEVKAATPMFMIKEPNNSFDQIHFSNAPIYHTDFLKTILVCLGLYNESLDGDSFGPSIYDYNEDDIRQRTWHYYYGEKNYVMYTFSGDTEDLYNTVINDEYEEY